MIEEAMSKRYPSVRNPVQLQFLMETIKQNRPLIYLDLILLQLTPVTQLVTINMQALAAIAELIGPAPSVTAIISACYGYRFFGVEPALTVVAV
jgi:hypothetical protein